MKRYFFVVMLLVFLLSSCEQKEEVDLPDDFVVASYAELSANLESTEKLVNDSLKTIGVENVIHKIYGNYEEIIPKYSSLDVFVIADTEKQLLISLNRVFEEWDIAFIRDVENGKVYYAPGLEKTTDIYDYKTGKLLSNKSMTHEEFQEKIKTELEEEDREFEEELEKLLEEYENSIGK